jgi:SAM-dependent methyltransferase
VRLLWRDVAIPGHRRPISTSLTADETRALVALEDGKLAFDIGSAYGFAAIVMAQVAEHVITVDVHRDYAPHSLDILRRNIAEHDVYEKVSIVVADAQNVGWALHEAEAGFGLVFIDGNHDESQVRRDIVLARALVGAEPGIGTEPRMHTAIAVHDYGEDTCPEVAPTVETMAEVYQRRGRLVDTLYIWEH